MKKFFFISFFVFSFVAIHLFAQEKEWDAYLAQYEKGPGSVLVQMSAYQHAPIQTLRIVLISGVTFKDCNKDGLPAKSAFEKLYEISDSVQRIVAKYTDYEFVGTFTYQCERLDYYYIRDTSNIRKDLNEFYSKKHPDYQPYTNIKLDTAWDAYLSFLYPNEEIYENMSNNKVLMQLMDAGDKLEKPRQVDHWIFFPTEVSRKCFMDYVLKIQFKIETKDILKDVDLPYRLQISRVDKVTLDNISPITMMLRKQAAICGGNYDGWETFVIK